MANSSKQPKSAVVFVADGSEEMEAVVAIDILRRAGVKVLVLAVEADAAKGCVVCSRGVKIVPDGHLGDESIKVSACDAVVVPGGVDGAAVLARNAQVLSVLADFHAQNKIVAAICAGTLAIKAAGIQAKVPQPLRVTSHPSVRDQLEHDFVYKEDRVVVDGHLVTSRGPGTAFEFGLRLVSLLAGDDKAREVAAPMLVGFEV
ncbi:hypothetical protein GGI07_003419 [Coemansia sp. Benny D115]|nr:hypothetical protein GGI07_003419 [Coemansia sp. Benny D115]